MSVINNIFGEESVSKCDLINRELDKLKVSLEERGLNFNCQIDNIKKLNNFSFEDLNEGVVAFEDLSFSSLKLSLYNFLDKLKQKYSLNDLFKLDDLGYLGLSDLEIEKYIVKLKEEGLIYEPRRNFFALVG